MVEKNFLRPADVAGYFGVKPSRIYKMIAAGLLPYVKIGRSIVVPKSAWDAWLKDQADQAQQAVVTKKGSHAEAA